MTTEEHPQQNRHIISNIRHLTFRDGFWFLLGGVLGCHLLEMVNAAVEAFGGV